MRLTCLNVIPLSRNHKKKIHEKIHSLMQQILRRSRLRVVLFSNMGVDQLLGEEG